MKKNAFLLAAAMITLYSCSVHKVQSTAQQADPTTVKTEDKESGKGLYASMKMKTTFKEGEPVILKFTVYNNADTAQQFCKWHTPFEPLISKYLEIKDPSGEEAPYQGAMAKRMMPPPPESYLKVKAKGSITAEVDLTKGYAIKAPGKYTVTYVGQNMNGLIVTESTSFEIKK